MAIISSFRLWQLLPLLLYFYGRAAAMNKAASSSNHHNKIYKMNGKYHTSSEIYSDINRISGTLISKTDLTQTRKPTSSIIISHEPSVNPDEYAGGVYVERELINHLPRSAPTSSSSSIKSTPKAIAAKLAEDLKTHIQHITIVIGSPHTGKSVVLARIEYELNNIMATTWTIRVDLLKMFPTESHHENINFDYIVVQHVNEDIRDIFDNLVKYNSKKIIFLFDGADRMTGQRLVRLSGLIKNLVEEKKIAVVLTGNVNTLDHLTNLKFQCVGWVISAMTFPERKNFLFNIWKAAINKQLQKQPPHVKITDTIINERLDDYASVFAMRIEQTPLPLQPPTLMVLAEHFELTKNLIRPEMFNTDFFVGCLDYVLNPLSWSTMSLTAIEYISINKKELYGKIVSTFSSHRNNLLDPVWFYGPRALLQIVSQIEYYTIAIHILQPINKYIKASMELSARQTEPPIFTDNDMRKYYYPDFRNYFAAEFIMRIMDLPAGDPAIPIDFIRRMFTNHDYHYLLEFINCQAQSLKSSLIRDILLPNNILNTKILDNIIQAGFENLYLQIHNELIGPQELNQLQKYFQSPTVKYYRLQRCFGMIYTPEPQALSNKPLAPMDLNRLNIMFIHNMLSTCKALQSSGIIFNYHNNYNQLLSFIVQRPLPNLNLMKFFALHVIPSTHTIPYDDLLYITISNVGEASIPTAKYLINWGANPQIIGHDGGTLLHAALKWNSPNLLRFVMEELNVKTINVIDHFGRTALAVCLDANPSPSYTLPGFWETLSYLVKNGDGLDPFVQLQSSLQDRLKILDSDIRSSGFRIMLGPASRAPTVGWMRINDPSTIVTEAAIFSFLISRPDARHTVFTPRNAYYRQVESFSITTRFKPAALWRLQQHTLALRRNIIMDKLQHIMKISPLEMLTHYRGITSLTESQRHHYRETIKILIERQQEFLTPPAASRIAGNFINNIADVQDLEDLKYFLDCGLLQKLDDQSVHMLRMKLENRVAKSVDEGISPTGKILVYEQLSRTRVDCYPQVLRITEFQKKMGEMMIFIDQKILMCLTKRPSRQIRLAMICHISWDDVDHFNDAMNNRRTAAQIQVNSDKFLLTLARVEIKNHVKAQQLLDLVRVLRSGRDPQQLMTGNSEMLVTDTLKHRGLINYRHKQRLTNIINDVWQPTSSFRSKFGFLLPSRSVAIYAAASIPIIRGIYGTINMCLQQQNHTDSNCLYASTVLALSATMPVVGYFTIKYTPWIIDRFSRTALDMLPSTASHVVRENLKIMRNLGFKYGAYSIAAGLAVAGVGFDIYNIVEMSMMIDMCNREENNCLSKDKIDYIISLSFSCVSIPVTAGLIIGGAGLVANVLVGLAMLAIEIFAMGINEIIYYSNKYHTNFDENARIFFHKVVFLPAPSDVQALARRAEWINMVQKRINYLLEDNENIVAYAIGLGRSTDNGQVADWSLINLMDTNVTNSQGLSRVLPTASNNQSLICLPKRDTKQVYDNTQRYVADAVYECQNAFVIAHKQRWNERNNEKYTIVYDLEYVKTGYIVGSKGYNNLFQIYNSTIDLTIIGGDDNKTDTYSIRTDSFKGNIIMNGQSTKRILDMSAVPSSASLSFDWNIELAMGFVGLGNSEKVFRILMLQRLWPNLHVIGRSDNPDSFICNWNNLSKWSLIKNGTTISIDGRGGKSLSHMDNITDCKISMVRPFTNVIGSDCPNATYIAYVWLDGTAESNITSTYSSIQPRQSKFIVTFANRPLLFSSISIQYSHETKFLTWNLHYNRDVLLVLSIEPYRTAHLTMEGNATANDSNTETVNCVFVDNYHGISIYPVINPPANGTTIVEVQHFNVIATINNSQLINIFDRYNKIRTLQNDTFSVVTKIFNPKTNQTFMFGSNTHDRFYIDSNTMFLFGGDGSDVYALIRDSPKYVWIDNEANDDAMDTLTIPDTTCTSLYAIRGSMEFDCCDGSQLDVTLVCSNDNSTDINVILRNYLMSSKYRHLQIYWHDSTYILLPYEWTQDYQNNADNATNNNIDFALLFSFGDDWQSTTLTLTSRDNYIVLNVTGKGNPVIAYRSGLSDVIMTRKYLNRDRSSFVILKDFFTNDATDNVATEWLTFKIFMLDNDVDSDTIPAVLTVNDIRHLALSMQHDNTTDKQGSSTLIQEYLVNINNITMNQTIVIEHNNNSQENGDYQLGVLIVVGSEPGEFRAKWNDSSLLVYTDQTRIYIKNWCIADRHRLYRIEFMRSLETEPIVIRDLNQLDCHPQTENNYNKKSIKKLNRKFRYAQTELWLDDGKDNDQSRLIKCVGSIFIDILAKKSMYKIFGFVSALEQAVFIRDNCKSLFTMEKLKNLTLMIMNEAFADKIFIFELQNKLTQEEKASVALVIRRIRQLQDRCWQNFIISLGNDNDLTFNNIAGHLSSCIPEL